MKMIVIEHGKLERHAKELGETFVDALIAYSAPEGMWEPLRQLHISEAKYAFALANPAKLPKARFIRRDAELAIVKTIQPLALRTSPPPKPGPGTHLKHLIASIAMKPEAAIIEFTKRLGMVKVMALLPLAKPILDQRVELSKKLQETLGCGCSSKARQMDGWGAEGCKKNMDVILGWLHDACQERGLPWDSNAAQVAVEMAIEMADGGR